MYKRQGRVSAYDMVPSQPSNGHAREPSFRALSKMPYVCGYWGAFSASTDLEWIYTLDLDTDIFAAYKKSYGYPNAAVWWRGTIYPPALLQPVIEHFKIAKRPEKIERELVSIPDGMTRRFQGRDSVEAE